ncbi:hypothetical protein CYLTODRAFT_128535 [Cylindrobasidium torrendii FP15055 ss-10]|uniref:DUF7330 domain-containing protein n=1 Tax=Cylindrobasidium torrendii FP15055 ss-10 TaxID=1314674 RepID=A0A0D7BMI7_9AGAR|nr:hypothetical protein CYLTODRAFT_128535 [Cylindrobasidium torrendii FP15055 ss-10]
MLTGFDTFASICVLRQDLFQVVLFAILLAAREEELTLSTPDAVRSYCDDQFNACCAGCARASSILASSHQLPTSLYKMMLVPDDAKPSAPESKAEEHAQEVAANAASSSALPTDAPPAYEDIPPPAGFHIPGNLKPSNWVYVHRTNDSVKESFAIDSALQIPESFLPAIPRNEQRKNLFVHTMNGGIHSTVYLLEDRPKAELKVESMNGAVKLTVHRGENSAFNLVARTSNGSVQVQLPPDFVGPVTLAGRARFNVSDRLQTNSYTFSESGGVRKMFVGDMSKYNEGDWKGDEMSLSTTNGSIKVSYSDERQDVPAAGAGFWGRMFGG